MQPNIQRMLAQMLGGAVVPGFDESMIGYDMARMAGAPQVPGMEQVLGPTQGAVDPAMLAQAIMKLGVGGFPRGMGMLSQEEADPMMRLGQNVAGMAPMLSLGMMRQIDPSQYRKLRQAAEDSYRRGAISGEEFYKQLEDIDAAFNVELTQARSGQDPGSPGGGLGTQMQPEFPWQRPGGPRARMDYPTSAIAPGSGPQGLGREGPTPRAWEMVERGELGSGSGRDVAKQHLGQDVDPFGAGGYQGKISTIDVGPGGTQWGTGKTTQQELPPKSGPAMQDYLSNSPWAMNPSPSVDDLLAGASDVAAFGAKKPAETSLPDDVMDAIQELLTMQNYRQPPRQGMPQVGPDPKDLQSAEKHEPEVLQRIKEVFLHYLLSK